jgi:hypothetical protein
MEKIKEEDQEKGSSLYLIGYFLIKCLKELKHGVDFFKIVKNRQICKGRGRFLNFSEAPPILYVKKS